MKETLQLIFNLYNKLYYQIVDLVREHQGRVDTKNDDGAYDTIYALWYDFYSDTIEENQIYAIKVKDNKLQILLAPTDECDEAWEEITFGNTVYLFQTLYNIAENIKQYL